MCGSGRCHGWDVNGSGSSSNGCSVCGNWSVSGGGSNGSGGFWCGINGRSSGIVLTSVTGHGRGVGVSRGYSSGVSSICSG